MAMCIFKTYFSGHSKAKIGPKMRYLKFHINLLKIIGMDVQKKTNTYF